MINQNFIKVVSAGSAVGLLTGRRTLQGYSFSKQVCAKFLYLKYILFCGQTKIRKLVKLL